MFLFFHTYPAMLRQGSMDLDECIMYTCLYHVYIIMIIWLFFDIREMITTTIGPNKQKYERRTNILQRNLWSFSVNVVLFTYASNLDLQEASSAHDFWH